MPVRTGDRQKQTATTRALARSALYRLLSQALIYPDQEAVRALQDVDMPPALQAAPILPPLAAPLSALQGQLASTPASDLQAEYRRVFSHVISPDCPPCEIFYTSRHVFQETQELSDIRGFYRAFGLDMAEKERPDHITVELEFMHFLACKEAYALTHHGRAQVRLCRDAQRKFLEDHLGRWALRFAQRLGEKAAGGYYGAVASLTDAFLSFDINFLRVQPEPLPDTHYWQQVSAEDYGCPAAEECPLGVSGGQYAS